MTLPPNINPGDPGHIDDHEEVHSLLGNLDGQSVFLAQGIAVGLASARPAASAAPKMFYYSTDVPQLAFSDGTTWVAFAGTGAILADSTEIDVQGAGTAISPFTMVPILGGMKSLTVLTASSGTYTTPAGIRAILIECIGGGGGGRGCSAPDATFPLASGGGGGGGGYANKFVASPAASYPYAVGSGGAGGVGDIVGSAGGTTTFGSASICTATGGAAGSGSGGPSNSAPLLGGDAAGGAGTVGDLKLAGGPGTRRIHLTDGANPSYVGSGDGGAAARGGGGGAGTASSGNGAVNGNPGGNYGGGGSGARSKGNGSGSGTGGDGAQGIIVVYEF